MPPNNGLLLGPPRPWPCDLVRLADRVCDQAPQRVIGRGLAHSCSEVDAHEEIHANSPDLPLTADQRLVPERELVEGALLESSTQELETGRQAVVSGSGWHGERRMT